MRAIVAIPLLFGILFTMPKYVAFGADVPKRLMLIQGRTLIAYFEGTYSELKQAEIFFGYGWLDDHRVFVAYNKTGRGEATAELEVIDLSQSQITKLTSIGGVGESYFDVNSSTGDVVYDDSGGIHLLRINAKTNSYEIINVKNVDCHNAFWVDTKTIGCFLFTKEKPIFMEFPLPK